MFVEETTRFMKSKITSCCAGFRMALYGLMVLCTLGLIAATGPLAQAATLATDKADYMPGEYVTFTGTGWAPGETVTIDVYESTSQPDIWVGQVSAVADTAGNISTSEFLVQQSFLGLGFLAYAQGLTSYADAMTAFTDAAGSYDLKWYAADPAVNKAPYLPTYAKLPPALLPCTAPSGGSGRAADPLANSVAYASPPTPANLDAVTSLAPKNMALCQIVPFFLEINVTGSTDPENGIITINPEWLAKTTSGGDFGFDPAYGVYCAFVDTADPGTTDLGVSAKVDSYTSSTLQPGTSNERIKGTIQVSGLNNGDRIIVEIWVVLKCTIPAGTTGNVQTSPGDAHTGPSNVTGDTIKVGTQTVPLLRVQEFFSSDADVQVTKSDTPDPVSQGCQLTYNLVVKNNSTDTIANGVVVTDTLDPNVAFVSAAPDALHPLVACTHFAGVVTCNVGGLSQGESVTITVVTTVSPTAPTVGTVGTGTCTTGGAGGIDLCNKVSVTAITSDPTPGNNSDTEPTDVLVLACVIAGPTSPVKAGTSVTFTGPMPVSPATYSYAWTVSYNGGTPVPVDGNSPSITFTAGGNAPPYSVGTMRVALVVTDKNGCTRSCYTDVIVNPPDAGCIVDINLPTCPGGTLTYSLGVTPPADSTILWTISSPGGCASIVGPNNGTTVSVTANTCCAFILTVVITPPSPGTPSTCTTGGSFVDTTPPVLSGCPTPTVSVQCYANVPPKATVTALDNCDGPVAVGYTETETKPGSSCNNVITRTWTATDRCDNIASCIQVITVVDTTKPSITCPDPVTVKCASAVPAADIASVTAGDTCGGVTVTHVGDVISGQTCPNRYTITRTYRGLDECGNAATCTQAITVNDQTAPVLTAPATVTVSCASDVPAPNPARVGKSDNCDPTGANVTVTHVDDVISGQTCPNRYTITRTYQGIDLCGNRATCEQTIRVDDRMAPSLNWPALTTVSCAGEIPVPDPRVVTATDGCGGAVTVVHVRDVISNSNCLNQFTLTRTYRATDACGNSAVCDQIIRVEDRGVPSLRGPEPLTVSCAGDIPAPDPSLVTATDTCGGPVTVVHAGDAMSVSNCLNQFTLRRTYRAIDACGNAASCTQTITVRDTTAPTLRVPADVVVECPADTRPSATGMATAQDGCGSATVRSSDTERKLCGGAKVITRTWTASDACGNTTSGTQTITVEDRRPPEISCELVCTYSQGGYGGWSGTPTDILVAHYLRAFPQGLEVGQFDTAGGNAPPNGLRWEGTSAGLAGIQQYLKQGGGTSEALGRDVVNPTDHSLGGELAHQAVTLTLNIRFNMLGVIGVGPNNFGALIYTQPGDSLSHSTVSEILAAGNRALAGLELPRGHTYSSINNLLDTLNHSFHECTRSTWSLEHLDAPRVIVQCAGQVPPPNPAHVHASDACGGPVTIRNLPDVISDQTCLNRFIITRTWLAWDACGNTNSCSYLIEVNDTTPPALECPADQTFALEDAWSFGEPVASDACGPVSVRIVGTETNQPAPNRLVATRTWEAVDACGNSQICQQTITVLTDRLVQSTFDLNDEGWRQIGGGTVRLAAHLDGDSQSGGYVSGSDGLLGNGWFWVAPPKFYGDRLAAYDGALEFALRQDSGTAPDLMNDVILSGGGITLVYNLPAPPDTDWHTYTIRLNEQAGWFNWEAQRPATQAEIMMVLASLDTLMIRGDYSLGTTPGSLDTVALLLPQQSPSPGWILEIFRVGPDQLMLRWPALAVGWQLEATGSFTAPVWEAVLDTPVVVNGMNTVTFTPTGEQRFFRLHKLAP